MRPIERIDNFIRKIDLNKLSSDWKLEYPIKFINRRIRTYWKQNPDQRFGQMLINLGLAPDSMEIWCSEDHDILINQGLAPEECIFWGSIYDKKGNPLKEPIYRLIKNLSVDHINNILIFMKAYNGHVSHNTMIAFENVLKKNSLEINKEVEDHQFDDNSTIK